MGGPSTFRRIITAHDVDLPAPLPSPASAPFTPVPSWVRWEPDCIWIYDDTYFGRAGRAAVAVEDLVSRKWLATVLSVEETSAQVEVAFTRALAVEGLGTVIADRLDRPPDRADATHTPVLLAWSDNGPQMTSTDTRAFIALHLIAQHLGRPATPEDQGGSSRCSATPKPNRPISPRSPTPTCSGTSSKPAARSITGADFTPEPPM